MPAFCTFCDRRFCNLHTQGPHPASFAEEAVHPADSDAARSRAGVHVPRPAARHAASFPGRAGHCHHHVFHARAGAQCAHGPTEGAALAPGGARRACKGQGCMAAQGSASQSEQCCERALACAPGLHTTCVESVCVYHCTRALHSCNVYPSVFLTCCDVDAGAMAARVPGRGTPALTCRPHAMDMFLC